MIEVTPNKCDFCGCCVGICPEDAIELKESEISIIEELCTNCSKCVWSCPIEVLKFNPPSRSATSDKQGDNNFSSNASEKTSEVNPNLKTISENGAGKND